MLNKKSRFKPLYKQFFKLRENVQNRKKLLKFKSKKWEKLINYYKKKLNKKFYLQDQTRYIASMYPSKNNSYKKRFKNTLNSSKSFRLFYGNISKTFMKKQIKKVFHKKSNKTKNFKILFIKLFEQRLDTILYRSKFCISLRNARQLVIHGKVFVNQKLIKIPSYIIKTGDLISINSNYYKLIENNFKNTEIWPIPPKYLSINYKTVEILFNGNIEHTNPSTNFTFKLNLEKILSNYLKL